MSPNCGNVIPMFQKVIALPAALMRSVKIAKAQSGVKKHKPNINEKNLERSDRVRSDER